MQKYLDYDVRSIFEEFQKAYFDSTGQRLMVGSEEFAISSVFSYALASLVGHMNVVALNRFLDTANGQYLDMIASGLGIKRTKEPLLNARFTVGVSTTIALNRLPLTIEISGIHYERHGFTEIDPVNKSGLYFVIYKADVPLNRAAIPEGDLLNIITAGMPDILKTKYEVYYPEYPSGLLTSDGIPTEFPYTPEGDAKFREYVKSHLGLIPGTAKYYETILSDIHPALVQTYCVKQYEPGYTTGQVKLVSLLKQFTNKITFPDTPTSQYKVDIKDVAKLMVEDLMIDFVKDPRYHVVGSEIVHSFADIRACYPCIMAKYDNVYGIPIEGSFDWYPMGEHKHVWTPAQCHYTLVTAYYSEVLCRRLGLDGVNTSELSALYLKPVQEIDGLEAWAYTTDTHSNFKEMFRNAVGVKAQLSHRVAVGNLSTVISDTIIKPTNALQVLEIPLSVVYAGMPLRANEVYLVEYI